MIAPELIDRAKAAQRNVDLAKSKIAEERAKLSELKMQKRQGDEERENLRLAEEKDAAIRLLDGEAAAPRKTRRVNRLAKLDEEAPALAAAITQQQQRVADAELEVSAPQLPFVQATLEIVAEIQGDGITEARAKLAELAPAAARLIAADQVRSALVGERFQMPRGQVPPFRGLSLVEALSDAIPERIRPAELGGQQLLNAAREISSEIIAQIKGNQS